MDDQTGPKRSAEEFLRLASITLGLAITVAELVWLIDTHAGTQPSRIWWLCRREQERLALWVRRMSIPAQARRLAPEVWWEAWQAMEEQS